MLDATVAGASADSYVTLVDAEAYFAARVGVDAWDALATDEDKERVLRQATRHIDRLRFRGCKLTTAQALQFPRDVQEEPTDEIPRAVQDACCEEALWVATHAAGGGRSSRQRVQAEGVVQFRVGQASEQFSGRGSSSVGPEAADLLARLISRTGSILSDGRETAGPVRVWWPFG